MAIVNYGPGPWVVFGYYFLMTMAIATLVGSRLLGSTAVWDAAAFGAAVPTAAVVGAIAAYFNRTIVLSVSGRGAEALQKEIEASLGELGFGLAAEPAPEGFVIYRRSRWGGWMSGRIMVKTEGTSATLIGRSGLLRRLSDRLSMARDSI